MVMRWDLCVCVCVCVCRTCVCTCAIHDTDYVLYLWFFIANLLCFLLIHFSPLWTARKSNQSILKEISPQGLMLKLQDFGHLRWRTDSLEKTLMLGKIEGRRRRGQQRMRWFGWHHRLNGHESESTPGVGDGQGGLAWCSPWGSQRVGHYWVIELNWHLFSYSLISRWLVSHS